MKIIVSAFFSAFLLFLGLSDVMTVLAQSGFNPINIPAIEEATGDATSLIALVRTMINYVLGFLGLVAVAIFIYGGFQYVLVGVNEGGAESGKKAMTYAVIGIVIILLSFVIVNALLSVGSGDAPDTGSGG